MPSTWSRLGYRRSRGPKTEKPAVGTAPWAIYDMLQLCGHIPGVIYGIYVVTQE